MCAEMCMHVVVDVCTCVWWVQLQIHVYIYTCIDVICAAKRMRRKARRRGARPKVVLVHMWCGLHVNIDLD